MVDQGAGQAKEELAAPLPPRRVGISLTATYSGFNLLHPKPIRVPVFYGIPRGKPAGQKESSHLSFEGEGITVRRPRVVRYQEGIHDTIKEGVLATRPDLHDITYVPAIDNQFYIPDEYAGPT
jgi:hypothetical protein